MINHDAVRAARDFAAAELIDAQPYLDSFADAPLPLYRRFHRTGLSGWYLPAADGGPGIGLEDGVDLVSELAYGDAGVAFTLFVSVLATSMVSVFGTPELRKRHLPPLAAEGTFAATLGSELDAGSELARLSTTCTRDGGDLVLTGEKAYSTNAGFADFVVVIARWSDSADHVAVLVPRDTPGLSVVKRWEMIGLRSSGTYQVSLSGVRVPAENALRGHGLRLLETGLNASRILIGATGLGIARRIRDECMAYAKTKTVRGAALTTAPVFAAKLGQMEMQIDVMRNQCRAAAAEYDAVLAGPDPAAEFLRRGSLRSALTCKMFCGQAGWSIATMGSEMFGGLGFTGEHVIGKLVRDMRFVSLVEGGDDVLRDLVYSRYVVPVSRRI